MSKPTTPAPDEQALQTTQPGRGLSKFKELLALVPTVEDDPTEGMLDAILHATSVEKWEDVFQASHFKDSANRSARIHAFRASPSQFNGRLPLFLILDVTWLDTGERGVLTCGSEMAMAQLLNAWSLGALPLDVEIFRKPTPTKAGFHPMRFKYLGRPEGPLGDPAQVVSTQ